MSVECLQATPPPRPYRFELLPEEALASALPLVLELEDGTVPEDVQGAVGRGLARALAFAAAQAEERRGALLLFSELTSGDPAEMCRRLAEHRPLFRSTELCRLVFDRCAEEVHHDPRRAGAFAELALVASEVLDRSIIPRAIWHDIRAETWAVIADSRRLAGNQDGAGDALVSARRHLATGSRTLLVRAEVLIREASLACDRGRHAAGLESIEQALVILRAGARPSEVVRAKNAKGRLLLECGQSAAARPHFEEAKALLDGTGDRALNLATHHNLAACLGALGELPAAHAELASARAAAKLLDRPVAQLRLRWLEGRLAWAASQAEEATSALTEARRGFEERHLGHLAAEVGQDLETLRNGTRRRPSRRWPWTLRPATPTIPRAVARRPVTDPSW